MMGLRTPAPSCLPSTIPATSALETQLPTMWLPWPASKRTLVSIISWRHAEEVRTQRKMQEMAKQCDFRVQMPLLTPLSESHWKKVSPHWKSPVETSLWWETKASSPQPGHVVSLPGRLTPSATANSQISLPHQAVRTSVCVWDIVDHLHPRSCVGFRAAKDLSNLGKLFSSSLYAATTARLPYPGPKTPSLTWGCCHTCSSDCKMQAWFVQNLLPGNLQSSVTKNYSM